MATVAQLNFSDKGKRRNGAGIRISSTKFHSIHPNEIMACVVEKKMVGQ
jgi:hypothetical protein